jgi:hypothetical protein
MQGHAAATRLYLNVGVTAHRDLVPAEIPGIEDRVRKLLEGLSGDFPGLPVQLITPLAEGGDRLAARTALSLGFRIVAVLPMEQSDYERDFASDRSLAEFRELLSAASDVITLPPAAPVAKGEPAGRISERERQYAQLGVFVSNHCQVLLALWDGKEGAQPGGTGRVVRYHLSGVMVEYDSDPTPAGLLADNENDLVYQVVCSRDRPGGEPADGLQALDAFWFSSRSPDETSQEIPDVYRVLLSRLQRFSLDWLEKGETVRANGTKLLADPPPLEIPTAAPLTDRLFRAADGLAVHYQRRVHGGLRAVHLLAVLMGLVFLLYSEYDGPGYMVLIFLALFFGGVVVHLIGESREWHRKYLDYRTLAEGLRVQLYWNLAGVVEVRWAGFAYDNFLQKQDVDLGWIRHVMRAASMYRARGQSPEPGWVSWVVEQWIGEPGHGQGQLAYYAHKHRINSSRFRRTRILGSLCLWAGILIAVSLLFLGGDGGEERRRLLLVLMGVLPLVAGIWDAYSHKKAEKELIKQYGFMRGVFTKARKLIDRSDDIDFQRNVLRALGEAALEEGAEWLLMHRERPLEHGRL